MRVATWLPLVRFGWLLALSLAAGCKSGEWLAAISQAEIPLNEQVAARPIYPTAIRGSDVAKIAVSDAAETEVSEPATKPDPTPQPATTDPAENKQPTPRTPVSTPLAVIPAALRRPQPEIVKTASPVETEPVPAPASVAVVPEPSFTALGSNQPPVAQAIALSATHTTAIESPAKAVVSEPIAMSDDERLAAIANQRDVLIAMLEDEIRTRREKSPADPQLRRLEQQLRLAYASAGREDDAAAAAESLPAAEREAYKHVLFGLATWLSEEEERRAPLRNARVLRSLREAAGELSAASKLDLRNLVFCEKVEHFGWYTEFPRYEFAPKQQVILYVEVDNFTAQEKGQHSFETELQGSYQIFDASGAVVAQRTLPLDRETCRNYRRDYFLAYRVFMPDDIVPGRYRLELTIEDLKAKGEFKGRKLGEGMVEFSVRN